MTEPLLDYDEIERELRRFEAEERERLGLEEERVEHCAATPTPRRLLPWRPRVDDDPPGRTDAGARHAARRRAGGPRLPLAGARVSGRRSALRLSTRNSATAASAIRRISRSAISSST